MTVVLNIVNARLLLGRRAAPRSLVVAALGVAGITALFWPEIERFDLADSGTLGLVLSLAGTLCFSLRNIASARPQQPRSAERRAGKETVSPSPSRSSPDPSQQTKHHTQPTPP